MEAKKLADADFETGMAFEQQLAAAQAALMTANAGYQAFVAILRLRYDAPEGGVALTRLGRGLCSVEQRKWKWRWRLRR